jgi:hypothetical protein
MVQFLGMQIKQVLKNNIALSRTKTSKDISLAIVI